MTKKIVLATGNAGKLAELQALLSPIEISVVPQTDFEIGEAVEDGLTFVENALIKARYACQHTGLPALADDSGLEVTALNGTPGIYSSRYAAMNNKGQGDAANNALLLKTLENETNRAASFHCTLVFMRHEADPTPLICSASWSGEIAHAASGTTGFGYDPIFYVPEFGQTVAELGAEVKKQHSHRAKALQKMISKLSTKPSTNMNLQNGG
ncbi:MAG: RdgB/HAM1 family non-canonical purine NTP pyrophosphatase [Pseudomonadota bacterium]